MPDLSAGRPLPLPEKIFSEEDVQLVNSVIGEWFESMTMDSWVADDEGARRVLEALAARSRLLPSSAEHREEWGVRMEWVQGPMDLNCADRETAEDYIVSLSPLHRGIAKLVRRVAGPWVEVDGSPTNA